MADVERTLIIVKPDGVQRGLVGKDPGPVGAARPEELAALKFMQVERVLAEEHYAEHQGKPFYEGLVSYIMSGPVVVGVFEGVAAVAAVRSTVGATNPAKAAPGTIRGDLGIEIGRNLIHASDEQPGSAEREVALWFGQGGVLDWSRDSDRWIRE
ncbi:MAG: nucleoside-diphosphate kinase [Thermomicrobiales bacterium]